MDRSRALVRYWRNCLADVDLRSPEVKDESFFRIKGDDFRKGSFPQTLTHEIFRVAQESHRRKREERKEELQKVSLLLAPFGLRRLRQHGIAKEGESRRYNPVWVPAFLTRDGELQRGEPGTPWIGREFLEPVTRDLPIVGALDNFDRFLTVAGQPAGTGWQDVLAYVQEMLRAVRGQSLEDLDFGEELEVLLPIAILWEEDRGIARAILDLYDKTLKQEELPKLLSTLATGASPSPAPAPYDLHELGPALRHLGQMGAHALSPSQRQTVHSFMTLPEKALLAVNGPPGTGKTTLLQSVVASLWVEAALSERSAPPVILACSTNNQAITNILDSFGNAAARQPGDPWTDRWLPGLTSYGLYLPSNAKLNEEAQPFQKAAPGFPAWVGLPEVMENPSYVSQAEAEYLARARSALATPDLENLEAVAKRLHEKLTVTRQSLVEWIEDTRRGAAFRSQHGCASFAATMTHIQREQSEAMAAQADQENLQAEILAALQAIPFWEDLLSFLPPIRERRNRRLTLPFLRRNQQPPAATSPDLAKSLPELTRSNLEAIRARLESAKAWGALEERLVVRLAELGSGPLDDLAKSLDLLDRLRQKLFLIAGRYWEARWLIEMKTLLRSGRNLHAQSRNACVARFGRFAMLTPCMVATFYQAPKALKYWDGETELPLFEAIDLLIVDEAGQVSPEVGAATFALAKRALVVGDIHQIEPVWGIPPFVDSGNLREAEIELPSSDENEENWAFRSSRGNLMSVARCATAFTCENDRGLFLSEHRRCVPEIIRFCNELVYQGRLNPLRPSKAERPLPALGWAHVTSPEVARGSSRCNPGEARVIADWLNRHRQELEEHYKIPLKEIVAVITPFSAQRTELERAFRDKKLTVRTGTVHTFQGAERPVVLFSTVYSFTGSPRSFFFDKSPNLLNVAVSRAKDSFLLFGDMRVFDPARDTLPSGKLARLAFTSEDGEITDITSAQHLQTRGDGEVTLLLTLEEHRRALREALEKSKDRVLIVSPYLTKNAVLADDIPTALKAAKERGVRICVVYSRDLNRWPDSAARVADMLSKAGAEVKVATRMHSKTLAVDGSKLIEGSFNWLSSKREEGHPHQYKESSLVYQGPGAQDLVSRVWRDAAGEEVPIRTLT